MNKKFDKLLQDREARALYQTQLQSLYNKTLIVIKANYVGFDKRTYNTHFVVTKIFFEIKMKVTLVDYKVQHTHEGLIFYLIVEESLVWAKMIAIDIESSTLGRLVDIDVYHQNDTCSRSQLNIPPRICYICDQQAHVCVRSQTHSPQDVINYFNQCVIAYMLHNPFENLVIYGLINELTKPYGFGCVGINHTGSHQDMDVYTFINSIEALQEQFKSFYEIDSAQFINLRQFGIQVEHAMFKATNGINTHKGAIFIFILIFAGLKNSKCYDDIHHQIALLCQDIFLDFETCNSHGARIFFEYNISGIRGDAIKGFKDYFTVLQQNVSTYENITSTYLKIISQIEDTNILHRSDILTYQNIKKQAHILQNQPESWSAFNEACILHNISCGGSSDALAAVLIISIIKEHYTTIKNKVDSLHKHVYNTTSR